MHPTLLLTLVIAGSLLNGCQPGTLTPSGESTAIASGVSPANATAPSTSAPAKTPSRLDKKIAMSAFHAFVPAQHQLVDAVAGTLTTTGSIGAVLIVEPESKLSAKLGDAAKRQVLLVAPDATGALRVTATNERIVPCSTCGGVAGDPYGYTRIGTGRFTIAVGGGSRERWSADYTFVYEPATQRFVVESVTRRVVDTLTDAEMETITGTQDFGVLAFEDFDPAQLGDEPTLESSD